MPPKKSTARKSAGPARTPTKSKQARATSHHHHQAYDDDVQILESMAQEDQGIEDAIFIVDKIMGKRLHDGIVQYKVKWKGYEDDADDTW